MLVELVDRMTSTPGHWTAVHYPRTVQEAITHADKIIQTIVARNNRQKAMLTRAMGILHRATEACTCGAMQHAIEDAKKEEDPS